jgi:hypothetical protein
MRDAGGASQAAAGGRSSRVRRRLFNLAAAVSLVLCVASTALWVRSYVAKEWLMYRKTEPAHRRYREITFISGPGQLFIQNSRFDFIADGMAEKMREGEGHPDGFLYLRQPAESRWGRFANGSDHTHAHGALGFLFHSRVYEEGSDTWTVERAMIPYWFVTTTTAVLPITWWRHYRRQCIRVREHRCLTCGYDLRATPERCPECGAVPALVR